MISMTGFKTKIGCIVILVAAILNFLYSTISTSIFMIGVSIALYGLYDRSLVNTNAQIKIGKAQAEDTVNHIETLKSRLKKPMLRGGA